MAFCHPCVSALPVRFILDLVHSIVKTPRKSEWSVDRGALFWCPPSWVRRDLAYHFLEADRGDSPPSAPHPAPSPDLPFAHLEGPDDEPITTA